MIFFKYLPHTYQGADHTGRRVLNMGGGGGGTSTTYTSNIPDWLRPQTEALLGAATQEYFNTEYDPATGGYNITGTKPYTPYSTDPRDYVAGFSPAQEQVFGEAARMETPGGFGQGAGLTTMSAINAMTPSSYQPYMSPYMQDVVNIQKQQAIEDAQRAQLGANLGAARSGTYGGARQTLLQGQREAGLQKTLSDIQAQGLQSAYDQARQAQQFGITTGMQAGSQLANIAAGQQQADLARLGFQGQMGDIQQQQQQAIINQAIQDYALSQEMPMQRLAGYNALLRGYATPTTTVSQYSAVNPLQALGAFGAAGSGVAALGNMGKKAGGAIKYAGGGGITDVNAIESFAEDLGIPQLQQSMQNKSLPKYIGMPILENKVNEAERMKMAQTMMASADQGIPSISDGIEAKANQLQGITAAPVTVAGGGMIAFEAGGVVSVKELQDALNAVNSAQGPAKQAAQAKYNDLLLKYRMQNSIASDTGAGVDMKPMGGIAPAPTPKLQPQGIAAAPKQEEPPAKQGITAVAEPTLEQEMTEYQKAMAAAKGEDTYGKFLEEQAKKNVLTDADYLLRAAQGFGAAGNILAGGDVSKELGTLAAQRAADVQTEQARAEAAAKRADIGREERGEAFKAVYGKREERAKEKRTEAREIAAEKRAEKTKERLTRLEASLRKDPDAFNRQLYRDLNSEDEATRAGAERWFASKQSSLAAYSNLRPTDVLKEWGRIQGDPMLKQEYAKKGISNLEQFTKYAEKSLLGNQQKAPKVGTVMDGYKFKGGDPSDPKNWEEV